MPQPGFEPGFLWPQRTVLTTRLLRQLLPFARKTSSYSSYKPCYFLPFWSKAFIKIGGS